MVEPLSMPQAGERWGVMAEFATPQALLQAAAAVRDAGLRDFDCYSPYPVPGLDEAMGLPPTRLPRLVLLFALLGAAGGYLMQWFAAAVHYPLNIGGRPLHSWPAFIPITFELAVLLGSLAAVIGMLGRNKLPMPYHPVFNVRRFRRASQDRFFLAIATRGDDIAHEAARELLRTLAAEVYDVEA